MKPALSRTSLPEVHSSVAIHQPTLIRRLLAYAGPAYLVSVGYMDPGNWATDLEGGARFGYQLLWVLVLSNGMAILLQTLAARLGIVDGRDLAQACRHYYSRTVCNALWILCEIAIAACDLAEVLGAAIALRLLFGLPLLPGVLLTGLDTIFVLWLSRYGIRLIEALVLGLIAIIAGCFIVELTFAKPALGLLAGGLVPRVNNQSLYVAVGILGATVMPHNLYLHSALVQTRRFGPAFRQKAEACRFNLIDSVLALNGALIVNAAILVLAATVFFTRHITVTQIDQAYLLLKPVLGTALASVLFAIALLASGLSSTLTGTFAGQIVMEGFLDLRMRPWLRRLVTRTSAIVPAALTIWWMGEKGTYSLLILSQVILSMQLPFAVIPLIRFTNDKTRMGEFANRGWVRLLAWAAAVVIVGLNAWLIWVSLGPWMLEAPWRIAVVGPLLVAVAALLVKISIAKPEPHPIAAGAGSAAVPTHLAAPVYRRILVPLDRSNRDRAAIAHASAMALLHGARLYLLHVEEDVASQVYGALSTSAETVADREYLEEIVRTLAAAGISAELDIEHGRSPRKAIVAKAREISPDLIVMGAHGHRGLKDLIFGNTINAVRHEVLAPVLVVGDEPPVR
jgi:manganese transport protein